MGWPFVFVSEEDQKIASHMADQRNVNEGHFGGMVFDKGHQYGEYDSWTTHYIGALGEMGAARFYDVEPDLVFLEKGGSNPWDLVVDDQKVEVKAGRYYEDTIEGQRSRPQHLYITEKKIKPVTDRYLRVAVIPKGVLFKDPTVYMVGWATREELMQAEMVMGKSGKCRRIKEDDLRPCRTQ